MIELFIYIVIGIMVLCLLSIFIAIIAGSMIEDKEPDFDKDEKAWVKWVKRQFNRF